MDDTRLASRTTRLTRFFGPVFVLFVFGGALWLLHHELKHYTLADLRAGVARIPPSHLGLAIVLTALNYVVLIGYDLLSIRSIRHPMPVGRVAVASFIGYTCSYNFGALLGGPSARYRLYSMWGLSAVEILKLLFLLGITFWVGFFALAGAVFLIEPVAVPPALHLPFETVRPLCVVLLGVVAAYVAACTVRRRPIRFRRWEFSLPTPALSIAQIVVASADLLIAAAAMFVLLPPGAAPSYLWFLGVYLLAVLAVLITHVPGGLGVFELVMIWSLGGDDPHLLLGSLLVFRLVYYLLPLSLAAVMLAVVEVTSNWKHLAPWRHAAASVTRASVPRIMTFVVFAAGVVLLFSGATPAEHERLHWLKQFLPLPVIEISHFLGSLTGMLLLLLARSLQRRIETAYFATIGLLVAGIALSLLKGLDYEEAVLVAALLAFFVPCRRHFYRRGAVVSERYSPGWLVAIACVLFCSLWLMRFAFRHVEYSDQLWWQFAFSGDAPRSMRALVGAACLLLLYVTARLLRSKPTLPARPGGDELHAARRIVAASQQTMAHLALLGDKYLMFDAKRTAMIMFGIEGRSWVTLGDPLGEEAAARALAWDFYERCDAGARWPVFYQVDEARLPLYVDMGLEMMKLGEEARVPLADFSLAGGARKNLRHTVNQAFVAGCSFEIVEPPLDDALLAEMHEISDAWLASKQAAEKQFSLGSFQPDYLRDCPAALVRQGGSLVAFANVWRGADNEELSLDLMRYRPAAMDGTMEFLFSQLMLWGKERHFAWFNLGMAPMSGIEQQRLAPLWSHVAALAFRHGEHFYNFQGLRQYKEKFHPVWRSKYLASPGGLALPVILTNVATLISGGMHKLIKK